MFSTRTFFRVVPAAWLGVFAAVAVGCGQSETDAARFTVRTYLKALADGNGQKACDQLTGAEGRRVLDSVNQQLPELGVGSCAAAIRDVAKNLGPDEKQTLRSAKITVHVHGRQGAAVVAGGTTVASLVKTGGRWLISEGVES